MQDIDEGLRKLMDRGFQFLHPRNPNGDVVSVIGVRAHRNVVDLIQLYGEHDAQGTRVSADEPDIFAPKAVLWRRCACAATVIDALLALPDPDAVRPNSSNKGCWVPTSAGQSKWLPMPA